MKSLPQQTIPKAQMKSVCKHLDDGAVDILQLSTRMAIKADTAQHKT